MTDQSNRISTGKAIGDRGLWLGGVGVGVMGATEGGGGRGEGDEPIERSVQETCKKKGHLQPHYKSHSGKGCGGEVEKKVAIVHRTDLTARTNRQIGQ